MSALAAFVADGTAIDWILGLVILEALALGAYRRYTGAGPGAGAIISLLVPGAFLLLALRCALTNAGAISIAGLLSAAFIAHLCDVALRWRGSSESSATRK